MIFLNEAKYPCRSLQNEEYIYGYLEEIVSITKAARLQLTILSENKRIKKFGKVLYSDNIRQVHVSAPCTFRLVGEQCGLC